MKNYGDIKSGNKVIIILFIVICLTSGFILSAGKKAVADQSVNIEQQQEKLKEVEQRKNLIQQELDRLKQEEIDYQNSLKNIKGLLNATEKELQLTQSNYANIVEQIEKMEEILEIEQNKLDLQMIILENRLKKFYKYNNISYLAVLLNSKDFSQFLNRYRYLENILANDSEIVKQVSEQVALISGQRESLYNKKEITKMLEQEIQKEKENIEISVESKNKYISRIEEERKNQMAILEQLEKSSVQIKEIIDIALKEREKLKQEQQQQQIKKEPTRKEITLQPRKGIFQLPLKGSIVSDYGQQKQEDLNAYIFNSGIDISAPLGEAVRAASVGTVIYIGNVKGYGDIVILDHGGNIVTLYAHLSKVLVQMNEEVQKGQIIGQVGTSGGTPIPQLHFEVRVEGKPVNPFDWL